MLKHNLKVALRQLLRQKFYTLLNISGLALGISVFAIIFFYTADELRYDEFEGDYEILRVSDYMHFQGNNRKSPIIPEEIIQIASDGIPAIENYCRVNRRWSEISIKVGENVFFNDRFSMRIPHLMSSSNCNRNMETSVRHW